MLKRSRFETLANGVLGLLAVLTILGGRPYFFTSALNALYALDVANLDAVSVALLQHRGMMVSVIGFLLVPSIVSWDFGRIAIPLVIFSKTTFVIRLLPHISQVGSVYFDIVAIILLAVVWIYRYARPQARVRPNGTTTHASPAGD